MFPITAALLDQIIERRPNTKSLTLWVSEELERMRKLQQDIQTVRQEWEKERVEYRAKELLYQQRVKAAQGLCKHELEEHHRDPSGNGDHHHECIICGRQR